MLECNYYLKSEVACSKGLGIIPGEIEKFSFKKNNLPLPHIGFTKVNHPNSIIWNDIPDESFFYFIHSFKLKEIKNSMSGNQIMVKILFPI